MTDVAQIGRRRPGAFGTDIAATGRGLGSCARHKLHFQMPAAVSKMHKTLHYVREDFVDTFKEDIDVLAVCKSFLIRPMASGFKGRGSSQIKIV